MLADQCVATLAQLAVELAGDRRPSAVIQRSAARSDVWHLWERDREPPIHASG
jgi:hypothetical protein